MDTNTTHQAPAASIYAGLSPEALLKECDRLQLLTNSQAQHIKNIEQAAMNVIADFSGVLLAHIRQDTEAVHGRLEAIVNKNVIFKPAAGVCH